MIDLFAHNLKAYESAVDMLDDTGKAAIIHPTGTGKSFIAFKLCEDNADKRFLWLSPSEYIFKTQIENLKATGAEEPKNIVFYTYAKLMYMSESEIEQIKPDYIILDEFHRCGAEMWGKGVQTVLNTYKDVPVLGLSATNIRYLDNQRDMADELFDGNVASQMTLGEAIVRGILNPPKYVTAIYSYPDELEKYERKVKQRKARAIREKAERYLEKLRRAIDKADGLDTVFAKHIENKNGKYLVFCPDFARMNELASQADFMFGRVNTNIHLYSVYSNNPETDKSFQKFKTDNSNSLRLLYCIDMLNEGIHVEDVDGVILFRPTVSPIVYKQQIGRALSASKKKQPVIFDIVNNFDNLYSVGALEEEMMQAVTYYRATGENEFVINERFKLIDEVRQCREIFEQIDKILTVSWNTMYAAARRYYKEHGDLLPLSSYTTQEGYGLGQWIVTQRTNRKNGNPALTQERIDKLNQIGMVWGTAHERYWEDNFAEAKEYFEKNGNLEITKEYSAKLNGWIIRQRQRYRNSEMPQEQYERLSNIGMVWELADAFGIGYSYAQRYYERYGNLDIPANYVTEDGYGLGAWYRGIRAKLREDKLTDDELRSLKEIGFEEDSVIKRTWLGYYEKAKQYFSEHGNLNVNANYETADGTKLGVWISGQRYAYGKHRMKQEQIELLEQIGMSWHRDNSRWEVGFDCAKNYFEKCGSLNPTIEYVTEDGFALGHWIAAQRHKYKTGKLSPKNIASLESLNIIWDISQAFWDQGYEHAAEYFRESGNLNATSEYVSVDGFKLGAWLCNQRTKYKSGKLSAEQIKKLGQIGMLWCPNESNWRQAYEIAKQYYSEHGNLQVPQKYKTDSGFCLGSWICTQRKAYRCNKLDKKKSEMLFAIGFTESSRTLEKKAV